MVTLESGVAQDDAAVVSPQTQICAHKIASVRSNVDELALLISFGPPRPYWIVIFPYASFMPKE